MFCDFSKNKFVILIGAAKIMQILITHKVFEKVIKIMIVYSKNIELL